MIRIDKNDVRVNKFPDGTLLLKEQIKAGIAQIGLNFVYMKQNADELSDELPKLIAFVKRLNKEYNSNIYQRSGFVLFQRKRHFLAGTVCQFERAETVISGKRN